MKSLALAVLCILCTSCVITHEKGEVPKVHLDITEICKVHVKLKKTEFECKGKF